MTGPPGGPAAGAIARFGERFGTAPAGVWQAPGRVNLIGEHTDYNDGFALPFAIDAVVTVAASRRPDGLLAMTSCQEDDDAVVPVQDLRPGLLTGWPAYPAGVVWALRDAGYPVAGLSLAVDADLRPGAGLASSAALECAVALAAADLFAISMPRARLAALARRAENEFAGVPTGILDQLAVLTSRAGYALMLDCRSGEGTAVPFDLAAAGLTLLIINTLARHALSDGGYASRRQACEVAAARLGVPALRDLGEVRELGPLTDELLLRRARHVITENRRVLRTAELLRAGRLADVGPLLTASHASLRDDFEVSWPEAEVAVRAAIGARAHGARMTGGGFGGSVIALTPAGLAGTVSTAVTREFAANGWPAPEIAPAVPSPGAGRVW